MSSLVERLRVRSDRKPVYNLDESDDEDFLLKKPGASQEKFERIDRSDAKEDLCQACGESGDLLSCATCNYAYHSSCLLPPLKGPAPDNWRCPECVTPLIDIDKLLDCEMRPTVEGDGDADSDAAKSGSKQIFVKQYLVKWKGLSYLHCAWVPEKEFLKAFKSHPRLKTKVNNFHRQMASSNTSDEDFVAIRPEWTTVDRIIACRGDNDEREYLVKWKELPYDECYWESESDISAFQPEIERFNRFRSRSSKLASIKQQSRVNDDNELKKQQKEFHQYEHSPEFLSGSLHPYQLEGLNFLRFSWSKQTHVILADEMGLGKTIQSIAFLASLFEEGVSAHPHLVVAPLSTLRNWEREFATWAPQMNVIMYVGSAQARSVIREYEFYFPKKLKKNKKKKSLVSESKHDRIKFDVLLTSYEMINLDTTSLKPIKWECMIVDEGHRLKNKDSKLFSSLKQYSTRHRVLLTGTPLQNNLDELFMLMHFLDAGKFASLEEFQEEFKDINQEEQISRLHKMLAPHLLRRVKKDVMKELPPKKELILRVDLSSKQKEYYKAILTRNYQILTRRGGAQISLINVVMELRKLCCHAYMLEGVEPDIDDPKEAFKQLLESSGKLHLLDKMMVKLKEQGHRVLIYSQFQHMLDLLEDYCSYKKWHYERIDGKVGGAERQIRIDRFNAKNSSRFCFLLSTRAGGLGINLATADTVVIYDSDWNPHADLQAMARAHRLGQTNKQNLLAPIYHQTRSNPRVLLFSLSRLPMGKNDFLTPKAIANRIKAKGLQKLRWYCQMCQKQCRDENGFKCHCMSEGHQRQMQIFGQNPTRIIEGYTEEFETTFLEHMKRSHRFSRVAATVVYNEYINDRNHVHMNSTEWATLTEFVKYLGRTGKCKVEETPKGWFITYIDRDSETLFKEKMKTKRIKADLVDEEKQEKEIQKQIERAEQMMQQSNPESDQPSQVQTTKELNVEDGTKIGFSLGSSAKPVTKETGDASRIVFDEVDEEKYEERNPKNNLKRKESGGGKSALEEMIREEERIKEKNNRKDYWLHEGIVVKVMSKVLAEKGYYKQKGVVKKVIDKYVGEIEMLESKHVLRVDQEELETVIPQVGGRVKIVNGAYRGSLARLLGVDTDRFCAKVQIEKGAYDGRVLKAVEYEDICKVA